MNNNDIEEDIKQYEELKKNKFIIASIEPDYFFSFVENILADRERLERENTELRKDQFFIMTIIEIHMCGVADVLIAI